VISSKSTLDPIDRKLISILQADARVSNVDLAAQVGLSPTPCSRRVKRLEDLGVITGYGARVNQAALGNGISVLIAVRLLESPLPVLETQAYPARGRDLDHVDSRHGQVSRVNLISGLTPVRSL